MTFRSDISDFQHERRRKLPQVILVHAGGNVPITLSPPQPLFPIQRINDLTLDKPKTLIDFFRGIEKK